MTTPEQGVVLYRKRIRKPAFEKKIMKIKRQRNKKYFALIFVICDTWEKKKEEKKMIYLKKKK
jgi:hypothetical protein